MKKILEVKKLKKSYGDFVLGPVDGSFPGGVIVGLIGENGAGKTTFIKSLLKILQAEGEIQFFSNKKEDIGVVLDIFQKF